MTEADIIPTLKSLIDGITIPPEDGGSAISKIVQVGWLDLAVSRNTSGQLTPTYTITKISKPTSALDASGAVSQFEDNIQVDVWCTQLGTYENGHNLREKMLAQLRAVVTANRVQPNDSIRYFEIVNEIPKDEPDKDPPIRRTMVLLKAYGFR